MRENAKVLDCVNERLTTDLHLTSKKTTTTTTTAKTKKAHKRKKNKNKLIANINRNRYCLKWNRIESEGIALLTHLY